MEREPGYVGDFASAGDDVGHEPTLAKTTLRKAMKPRVTIIWLPRTPVRTSLADEFVSHARAVWSRCA